MMQLNNFKQYEPTGENYIESVQFFISDEGIDFYDSFELFKLKYKIGFDKEGIVRTVSEDISAIYPLGLSIADVDSLPAGFSIDGRWIYKNGAIIQYELTSEEQIFFNCRQKQSLLDEATAAIAPLQDAFDLGIATDEERERLMAWKKYRVLLNRVDVSSDNHVQWPQKP
ncbi:tail fiber assembly protein [Providencia alcalifaciens]|uniref:Tail fiber assembly protein n=1 Tax=Providencia alcalifaciens 205/92 TaxID=1256988 RepID=A0AAV3M3Z9_9GAMM|nr:tail fiber assembly protein [Providencia alcalifaciens]EUD10402.1 tail fiber assembly protein [Providencia alcalifaciens 205/92]WGZ54951.1 tail fiber assembly protein [Providencia alcalifaciens]